jgi:hypothetical protein
MSIVKITDKRIGVTYVYNQQKGVWDSEKQQMRSKRTLIGKVDPETGETVPTKGWGKNRSSVQKKKTGKNYRELYEQEKKAIAELREAIAARDIEIAQLKEENHKLKKSE